MFQDSDGCRPPIPAWLKKWTACSGFGGRFPPDYAYFPKTIWQRCQAHYQKNAGAKVPQKAQAGQMITKYQTRFPALTRWLEETIPEPLAVFALPRELRKRMRTTNGLERYHEEVKRRTNVVRIFPNRASCLRLVSALAMEQSEEWMTGRRYLQMDVLEEINVPVHQLEVVIPETIPA